MAETLIERIKEAIKPIIMWDGDRLDMNLTSGEIDAIAHAALSAVRDEVVASLTTDHHKTNP